MILYLTKQTVDRFKIKLTDDMINPVTKALAQATIAAESGDPLLEWGGKLFYFDRRKCIQVVNFASKFTLYLIDIKVSTMEYVPNAMIEYMLDIYSDNTVMVKLIKKFAEDHPFAAFAPLKDRSCIATLNRNQTEFAYDGYKLYDYISDGILHTKEFNKDANYRYLQSLKNGKGRDYFYPGEKFEELLKARYNM